MAYIEVEEVESSIFEDILTCGESAIENWRGRLYDDDGDLVKTVYGESEEEVYDELEEYADDYGYDL